MIKYKTFKGFDLMRHLRDNLDIDIDELSEEINYLSYDSLIERGGQKNYYFTAWDGEKLIGVLKLKTKGSDSLSNSGYYNWLSFCSILEEYRNIGISSELIENMFKFMVENNISDLLSSGYTSGGLKYLEPKLERISREYNIDFKDKKVYHFSKN